MPPSALQPWEGTGGLQEAPGKHVTAPHYSTKGTPEGQEDPESFRREETGAALFEEGMPDLHAAQTFIRCPSPNI
ncbi:unnamed protein product [Ranitomeya imitator]|uniref:Uncharacterized protein n=1 Tax=Ranitomeya imitator TaxID=111125 RepID=A0ABN9LPL0_9NEOB|nr:unnamed protein product [Ranitomeya imitator]